MANKAERVVSQGLQRNIVDLARKELKIQAKVTPQNHLQPSDILKQEEKAPAKHCRSSSKGVKDTS
jgi:hypothetical protein